MADDFDRTIWHRDVTTDDTPLLTLAERTRLEGLHDNGKKEDQVNGVLQSMGAPNIEFGFYAIGDDGGVATVTIVGLPSPLNRLPESQAPAGPRLRRLAVLTVTLGTSTETNLNPITGLTVAGTWRAADTIVAAVEGTGIKLWDAAAGNGVAVAVIDPLQCPRLFAYISGLTNITRFDICARRVTKFK